jgi:hypothetical protein
MPRFASLFSRSSARPVSRKPKTFRFETLEGRQLMAAAPFGGAQMGDFSDTLPSTDVGSTPGSMWVGYDLPLASKPGAAATLYLDFNGHFQKERIGATSLISWTPWFDGWDNITTPVWDTDGDSYTFSADEQQQIRFIWASVAEDYAPFNINVTTIDPAPGGFTPPQPFARVVVSGGKSFADGLQGLAEIGAYADGGDPNVGYVFAQRTDGSMLRAGEIALCVTHESGHLFGLDERESAYNKLRTPLMRPKVSDSAERYVWWGGEMDVIANSSNGFGYRADDHNGSFTAASNLNIDNRPGLHAKGVIERTSDTDMFRFETGGGNVSINITLPQEREFSFLNPKNLGNLDASLRLYGASGALLATDGDPSLLAAITQNLAAGTYYVQVGSFGQAGDVGQYSLSVKESTGARIVSSQYQSISSSLGGLWVTFNEPINAQTFTIADVRVNGAAAGVGVKSVQVDAANSRRFLITYVPSTAFSQTPISVGPHIADRFGNHMDQNQNGVRAEAIDVYMATLGGVFERGTTPTPRKSAPTKSRG